MNAKYAPKPVLSAVPQPASKARKPNLRVVPKTNPQPTVSAVPKPAVKAAPKKRGTYRKSVPFKKTRLVLGLLINFSLIFGIYVLVDMHLSSMKPGIERGLIPNHLKPLFIKYARAKGLPPELIAGVAYQESKFNRTVCSPAGACGLMQFMPGTAVRFKVDRNNEESSIRGAVDYLVILHKMFNGNVGLSLAAYNWGEGSVQKWLAKGADPQKMPEETRNYVRAITGLPIQVWLGRVLDADTMLQSINIDSVEHTTRMREYLWR